MYWTTSGYRVIAPSLLTVTNLKIITLQVFLLVDEGTVKKYKADLSDEIEPQITELISRAEKGMEALQKKRLLLQRKVSPIITYHGAIGTKGLEPG